MKQNAPLVDVRQLIPFFPAPTVLGGRTASDAGLRSRACDQASTQSDSDARATSGGQARRGSSSHPA